jgi:hypothetical protein
VAPNQPPGTYAKDPRICYGMRGNSYQVAVTLAAALHARQSVNDGDSATFTVEGEVKGLGVFDDVVIKITGKDGRCVEHCIQVKHHTGIYRPADLLPGKNAQLPAKKFFDSWSKLAPVGHSRVFYIVSTASPSPLNTILNEQFRTEHEDAPHLPFFNPCKSLRKASPDTMSDILSAADVPGNEQQLRDFFEKAYRLSLENKEVDEYEIYVWQQFSKVYPDKATPDTFLCLLMQVERWVRQVTSEGQSITAGVLDNWVRELSSESLLYMLCLGKKAIFFPRVDFEDLKNRIKGFLSPDNSASVMEVRGAPQSGKATAVVRALRDLREFARCTAVSGILSPTETSDITLATDIIIVCHCRTPRAWVQACRDGHYQDKKMIIVHSSTEKLCEHSVVAQLDVVEALMGKVDRVQVTSSKWLSVEGLRLMSGLGELTIAELERALGAPDAGAPEAGARQPKRETFFPLECSLAVLKFDTGSLATVGLVVLVRGEPGAVVNQLAASGWHSHEFKASTADVLRAKIDEMAAIRRAEEKLAHKFIVVACHSRVSEMVTAVRDARQHGVVVVLCADKQAQTGELPHDLLVLRVVDEVLTVVSGPAPPTASNWVSVGPSASPVYSVDQPCGRHIVVGGPGAGKSFLFAEMLAMWKSGTEPANHDSVWCAHVVLKDLRASVEEWGLKADALVEATVAFVVGHFIEPLPEWAPLATQDVHNGRAVYLLDGWDEMRKGDWSQCRSVLQFLSTQPHVLLSSRPSDLPGREVGVFLERRNLQPFSKAQVLEYFKDTPGLENIVGLLPQLLERQATAVVGIPLHCKVLKHVLTTVLQVGAADKMDWSIVLSPAVLYKWYVASRCLNVDRISDAIARVDTLEPALLVRRERRCYWELRWLERTSLEFFDISAPDNERARALTSLWPTGEEDQALTNDAKRVGLLSEHLSYKEYLAARALVDAGRDCVRTVFADHKFERRLWGVWRFVARLCDGTGLNLAGMVNTKPTDCIGNCAGDLLKHIALPTEAQDDVAQAVAVVVDHIEVEVEKDNDAEEEHEMPVVPTVNVLTADIPHTYAQRRDMAEELGEEKDKKAEAAAKLCQFSHHGYIVCQSVCMALENLGVPSDGVRTHLMMCMTHTGSKFDLARASAASAYLMLGYDPGSGHVVPAVNALPSAVSWSKLPKAALRVLIAPVQENLQKGDTHPYLPDILTSSAAAKTLGYLLADLFVGKDSATWRKIYYRWNFDACRLLHVWMTRECWQDQKEKLVQLMLQLSNKNALQGIVSVLIGEDCMTPADVDTLYSGRDVTGYWDTDAGWPCAALLDHRLTDKAMDYLRRSAEKWGLRQQFEFDALSPSAQRRLLVAVGSAVGEIPTSWMARIDVPHFLQILSWDTRPKDEHGPLLHVVKHYANRHRLAVTVAGSTICLVADSSHRLPYAVGLSEVGLLSFFSGGKTP